MLGPGQAIHNDSGFLKVWAKSGQGHSYNVASYLAHGQLVQSGETSKSDQTVTRVVDKSVLHVTGYSTDSTTSRRCSGIWYNQLSDPA